MAFEMMHPAVSQVSLGVLHLTGHTLVHPGGDVEGRTVAADRLLGHLDRRVPVLGQVLPVFLVRQVEGPILDVLGLDGGVSVAGVGLEVLGGQGAGGSRLGLAQYQPDALSEYLHLSVPGI